MIGNRHDLRLRWPLAVLAIGTLGTVLAMVQLERGNAEALRQAAQAAAERAAFQIGARVQRYQYGLLGLRGAIVVAGVARIDADTVRRYSQSRDYEMEFPGARGFGFIRRVAASEAGAYTARMRAVHGPDFAITQLHPHAGERYVIELIEPLAPNRRAVGLDIASEPSRREAAQAAMRSGSAVLTAPITLVQARGYQEQSFLLLLPVYADGAAAVPATVVGWTYAPLVMDEVLRRMASELPSGALVLDDVSVPQQPRRFHAEGSAAAGAPAVSHTIAVLGRQWRLGLRPGPAFVDRLRLPAPGLAGAIGAVLTLLCCALAGGAAAYRERQGRLRAAQAHLAAIVESSTDAIIGSSLDGIVETWNRGAERMFGYPAAEAIGHTVAELIVPPELQHEERAILAAMRRHEPFEIVQTRRRRRDGRMLEVSMAVSPIRNGGGAVVGGSKTIRDISALVEAQRKIGALNASLERDVANRTEELEAARRVLRTVLDAVPAMIGYWDSARVIRVANRAYAGFFGLEVDKVPGHAMRELLGAALYEEIEPYVLGALRGEPQHFERRLVAHDGSVRHSLADYLPDLVDGVVAGFYVIVHDVSDLVNSRQALASALRENDVLVRTINEQLIYSVTDAAGTILEVNDNFCRALGYRREQLIGTDHRLLKSAEHDAGFWADMWHTIGAGKTWHGTICNRGADGAQRWFDTVIAPYFNEHQAIERYVALRTDVTARHAADAALRHLSALLGNVLRAASEMAVIATDQVGTITLFNVGAQRMLGYAEAELVGRESPARLHDPDEVAARARVLSAESGQPVAGFETFVYLPLRAGAETREWTYVRKDGSRFPVSLTVTAMRDEHGVVLGFLGVAIDISQRKRDEAALRQSMQLVEQASRAKSEFVANISHEIRTPMNAMLGMLTLARRTELTERQRDYLDKAAVAGDSLLGLLNDVLDFSKIEARKLELEVRPFALEDLLHELAVVLTGNNATKTVDVMFDVDPALPPSLEGDRRRLLQVMINLAGNALKFTYQGNVVVGVAVLERSAASIRLRFGVRDSGIGIAADQLTRIFDSFTQAEASTARRFGGTGLGLAISSQLVGLMGGTLEVSSEPGQGSHFWFDLTLGVAPDGTAVPPAGLAGMRVLVVDDNQVSGDILLHMVDALGCDAEYVDSGHAALERVARARVGGAPFDVVLMDLRMPGMNGLQAAAKLADGDPHAPPVVIVTAYAQDELRVRDPAGVPHYRAVLTKPVTPGTLVEALRQASAAPAPAAPPQRPQRLEGMRLLVVEDNVLNQQVACELLEAEGASVDLADNGARALELAADPALRYAAILMDVQMPGMDGLEATRRIRLHASGTRVPIVAMTANASTADRDACLAAGMDAHIGKPFDIDEVVGVLLQAGAAASPAAPQETGRAAVPAIDLEGALRRFQGNVAAYRRALDEVERDAQRMLGPPAGQAGMAPAVLHALKGLALTVGANGLADRFAQAYALAATGSPGDTAAPVVTGDVLAQETAATVSRMRAMLDEYGSQVASADAVAAAPLADAECADRRATVLDLLDSGNLRAVDLVEALAEGGCIGQARAAVLEAVRQLRFADAAALLRSDSHGGAIQRDAST